MLRADDSRRAPAVRPDHARAGRQAGVAALPKPGPCVHRNVTSVVSKADEVVAWLCKSCDAKLPADWSVREEDL